MDQVRMRSSRSAIRDENHNHKATGDLNLRNIKSFGNVSSTVNTATAATAIRRPASNVEFTRRLSQHLKSEKELQDLAYHRSLAYDALTQKARKSADSHHKKKGHDPRQTQTHPPISRPASSTPTVMKKSNRQERVETNRTRGHSTVWHPQQPAYAFLSQDPEIYRNNNANNHTQYLRRPKSTPLEQDGHKTRRSQIGQKKDQCWPLSSDRSEDSTRQRSSENDMRSNFNGNSFSLLRRAVDSAIQNGLQDPYVDELLAPRHHSPRSGDDNPESTQESNNSPTSTDSPQSFSTHSSQSSTASRGRHTLRTRPSSPAPSRSPSPSRGAWISDNPHQGRPSFRERARQRISENLHINLRKAGIEPQESGFTVHSVVKTSTEYVPRPGTTPIPSTRPTTPVTPTSPIRRRAQTAPEASTTPEVPSSPESPVMPTPPLLTATITSIPWEGPTTPTPFAMHWRNQKSNAELSGKKDEAKVEEDKKSDDVQRKERIYKPENVEKLDMEEKIPQEPPIPTIDFKRGDNGDGTLFLENIQPANPDSFFATEWSRQQAQKAVTPVALLNPFQPNPLVADASKPGLSRSKDRSRAPSDDRVSLPSRSRQGTMDSASGREYQDARAEQAVGEPTLVIAEVLSLSPEELTPPDAYPILRRKRGTMQLR
ncbi:hypothetical protein F5Y11DRAFT_20231 [Daldinia sp. FL1419]|nr:hypothetical protein F5Y11DRAFT_20231 [Daldinia sp. FL1419]